MKLSHSRPCAPYIANAGRTFRELNCTQCFQTNEPNTLTVLETDEA